VVAATRTDAKRFSYQALRNAQHDRARRVEIDADGGTVAREWIVLRRAARVRSQRSSSFRKSAHVLLSGRELQLLVLRLPIAHPRDECVGWAQVDFYLDGRAMLSKLRSKSPQPLADLETKIRARSRETAYGDDPDPELPH
jgi:hypothetical protein